MAPRSKEGNSPHDHRNIYLRNRVKSVIPETALPEFVRRLNTMAAERGMRWYKGNKDVGRSIRRWFEGEAQLYFWALDVVELTIIEIEAQRRASKAGRAEPVAGLHRVGEVPDLNEIQHSAPSRNIEAGTVAELDALREIVMLFHPLSAEARQRTLRYLESL